MNTLVAARAVYCLETSRRSSSTLMCNEFSRTRRTESWRCEPRAVARMRLQALPKRHTTEKCPLSPWIGIPEVRGAHFELASQVNPMVIRATRITSATKQRVIPGGIYQLLRWLLSSRL
jgi:hypothetical protein